MKITNGSILIENSSVVTADVAHLKVECTNQATNSNTVQVAGYFGISDDGTLETDFSQMTGVYVARKVNTNCSYQQGSCTIEENELVISGIFRAEANTANTANNGKKHAYGIISEATNDSGDGDAYSFLGAGKFYNDGEMVCSSDIVAFDDQSDIRLKKDIVKLDDTLSIVKKIETIRFNWKEEEKNREDGIKNLGFSAQNLLELVPEVVKEVDYNGSESIKEILTDAKTDGPQEPKNYIVKYDKMTVILTKAIQEQQEMIEKQQAIIEQMQKDIKELRNEI